MCPRVIINKDARRMIQIKDSAGNIRFETEINAGSKRGYTLMKEDYLTLKFSVDAPIYFKLGDGIDHEMGLFELTDLQQAAVNESNRGYDYDLRLEAYYWKWKNKAFMYVAETVVEGGPQYVRRETSWNLTATLDVHLTAFVKNLAALGYTYRGAAFEFHIDPALANPAKGVQYDNTNLVDALTRMAEAWECEWWVTDNQIHLGRCEFGDPVDFELDANVSAMSRSDGQNSYATRIYAFGSTRNLPADYRLGDENAGVNGGVQRRLMLPAGTAYLDAHPEMIEEEAVEDVVVFEEVYPRRTGTLSGIHPHEYTDKIETDGAEPVFEKWNAYRFRDAGLTFSKEYILPGQELHLIFQSGVLNGMDFAVTFNPCDKEGGETPQPEKNQDESWNLLAQVFEIVRNESYGCYLPADTLVPKEGDTYLLYGFDTKFVSDRLIGEAEEELKLKAQQYIDKSKVDPATYACTMMPAYIDQEGALRTFEIGDRVNLLNPTYFAEGRQSRIIGYEYSLDMPSDHPVYTVGETAAYSRLGAMQAKIDSLTYKDQSSGGGWGSGVYLITSSDSTQPTDRNAYSSKRALRQFLRKDQADRTGHFMELLGGLAVKRGLEADGIIVKSALSASQLKARISPSLTEEGEEGAMAGVLVEEDGNPEGMSAALMEVPGPDGATTFGGLTNVDKAADEVSDRDVIAVKPSGEKNWKIETLVRTGWISVDSLAEREVLDTSILQKGFMCYVFADDLLYRWTGTAWEVKEMSTPIIGVQRNVRIVNNLDSKNVSASKGEPCVLKFTFVSQERYKSTEPYENTGERGLLQVSVKNTEGGDYVVVKQLYVSSATPLTLDVTEYLTSGANNIMLKVTGEVTGETAPAFVYTVQLTSLSVSAANFKWWTAYSGDILFPLNIGGNISKVLHVTVSGTRYNQSYQVPIGTGIYIETAYNYAIAHPGKSGVFKVSAYVANTDGSIQTRTISLNVICIVAGAQVKLIAINNVLPKATNWVENTLFDYAMYDGDNVYTAAGFVVSKEGQVVFASNEDSIATSARHSFTLPLEVSTMDNSEFTLQADVMDGAVKLTESIPFAVNNSLGYAAVAGATLYVNPRTRSNRQDNYREVINEVGGTVIPATWENMNWGNDGWTMDADGNRVLRLMAGAWLRMDYSPFGKECARSGKTLEIDYKVDNVTDYVAPVFTVSTPSGDSFIGLNIYADEIIMHSQSLRNDTVQSLHTFEGKRTKLTLTILPDAYGNSGFNLCALYINGVKNREFTYENNDYFAQDGAMVVGSEDADVDIYGIREYPSALTSQGVLTNYINWLTDTTDKAAVKADNDILDSNGSEIDFENTKDQFNVLVYDHTIPSMADQTARTGTLEVMFCDHPEWNVSITNVAAKGQGTSSMKYYLWNTRYQLDKSLSVVTHADGTTSKKVWQMVPWAPAGQKFTAKKNYASSMQSHKIGAVNSYEELYREMGLLNEAMQTEKYANARVAVYQLPFVCFEKSINEEGETVHTFKGLYTFGPDKGDKYTFGHDTDLFPGLISIEGSDNSPLCTLFRVPWNQQVVYNEDEEAFQYNGANSWDFGGGETANISKFIPAYHLAYQCSPRLLPFVGTPDELNAQVAALRTQPYEYWIAKAGDAHLYHVYYFESSLGAFIPSDIGSGTINLASQLAGKGYGLTASDLAGKTPDELNALFIRARIAKFRTEASLYWNVDDTLFFMNNVEFNAGTDERAKNTYPYSFGTDTSKWAWRVDDADTRFDTTNRGLPDKSYSVETHDVDETGASIWNGETNNLFNLMEQAFPDEKVSSMRKMMASMQSIGGLKSGNDLDKLYAFYRKYFFDQAQEYFPANAYNLDARISYENGKLAYINGSYSNDTDPITQSLGDHYLAEQRWITKRIIYMMSKYSFGLFSANGTDTITVRAAGNTIKYELTPAMDLYPAISNGTSIIRGARTKAGSVCQMEIELSGSGDQQNTIQGASYLMDIGDWYDKNVSGSMIIQGRMLRDIRLGSQTEPIVISISSLTISNCVSLQTLLLSNIATLSGNLNLSACTHLREVYADGTSLVQLRLPSGGGLQKVEFSAFNRYLSLQNYPLLTNDGIGIDLCKGVITDFFVVDCPKMNPMQLLSEIIDAQVGQADHALKRVRAVGFDETYHSSDILDKLATLADGSYIGLSSDGLAGEDELPVLDGRLNVFANAYEQSIEALRNTFKKLALNHTGKLYIKFEDPLVEQLLVSRYDTEKDGYLTRQEAESALFIHGTMFENKSITSFEEFGKYFSNIETIGIYAFRNSTIERITFPANLKFIDVNAFQNTKIREVHLPDSVQELKGGVFAHCTLLKEVTARGISAKLADTFRGCSSLTRAIITGTYTIIESYTFENCTSLVDVEIADSVISMGNFVFRSCAFSSFDVPKSLQKMGNNAFEGCSNLKSISIPDKVISTGVNVFYKCTSLIEITVYPVVAPTIENNIFNQTHADLKIYVPDTSVNNYKTAANWSVYAHKIYPISSKPSES